MKQKVGWAEAIQAAFRQEADVVPPEWKTLDAIAKELGQDRHHVCRKLKRLVDAGRAETKKFRTWSKGGGKRMGYLRANRHYRLIMPPARDRKP